MKKSRKFISLSSCLLCATWAQAQEPILPEIQIQGELDPIPYRAKQTAVASKLPQTVRDIPQSVSALTRAQMDDQNMVTVWDALSQITGVQAVSNDLTQGQYHARGSSLESQNDGAPSGIPLSGYQQFDLAAYERIEVLRGQLDYCRDLVHSLAPLILSVSVPLLKTKQCSQAAMEAGTIID